MTLDVNSTASELLGRAREVELKHEARRATHELDHSLWRLDDYILEEIQHNRLLRKEDYPSFTSNAPKTLSRVVTSILNKNKIVLRALTEQMPDLATEEEDVMSANERLISGAIHENDLVRRKRGDNTLQWDIAWYIIHRGGVAVRPLYKPEDPRQKFRVAVYDPFEISYEKGDDCLEFFVRKYNEDKATVESTWRNKDRSVGALKKELSADANDEVEIWDIWYLDEDHNVINAVIANDDFLKEPTDHSNKFQCNPVYVIRASGAPSNNGIRIGEDTTRGKSDNSSEQWESIYTNVRTTIGWINRSVTLFATYLRNGAIGPFIYKGKRNKSIEKGLKPFKVIEIGETEDFGPVSLPQMAQEAKEFMDVVRGEWQKAGVADIVFGDVPFTLSGFGMVQLRGAVEILINSFIIATEDAFSVIADELTKQFVKTKKQVKVTGFDGREKPFFSAVKPKDITREYIIKAKLNQGLPKDNAQIGNAANLWRQAGVPRKKLYEQLFEFEDAENVNQDWLAEQALAQPAVLMTEIIKSLLERQKFAEAQLLLALMQGTNANNASEAPSALNPSEAGPSPENAPPELQGAGEQSGVFPQEPTGRPPANQGVI